MKISIAYSFLPKQQTSHTSVVMDHFGLGFIAEAVQSIRNQPCTRKST
jgi:hypothetical protein